MTPLMQTIAQGAIILVAAVFVPMFIRAARRLLAKQQVGDLGGELKEMSRELTLTSDAAGSWFTRFAPVFIFAAALIVALITPTVMTESVLTKLSDVAVVATLISAAVATLALARVDQGGEHRFAHVGLVLVTLLTAFAAVGSAHLLPRILAVIAIVFVASEMLRKTTVPFVGFSKVTSQVAFAMFGVTLGFVASHIAYQDFAPASLLVKGLAVLVALALVEEITDRLKFTNIDRLILATAIAMLAFLAAAVTHILTLV